MGRFITGMYVFFLLAKLKQFHNQCAIPAFEGLFPGNHDVVVHKLLFELAIWHGLAKLCLHMEMTMRDLETSTTWLGELLRMFQLEICPDY